MKTNYKKAHLVFKESYRKPRVKSLKEEKVNYNELLKNDYKDLDDAGIHFNVEKTVFEFDTYEDASKAEEIIQRNHPNNTVYNHGFSIEIEESLKEDIYDELDSLDIDEVLDWISDHKELYSDFKHYFNYRYNTRTGEHKNLPSIDEIVEWLEEHETAFEDFKLYFFEEEDDDDDLDESLKEDEKVQDEPTKSFKDEVKNAIEVLKTIDPKVFYTALGIYEWTDERDICDTGL